MASIEEQYTKIALKLFGGFVEGNTDLFSSVNEDLKKAGLKMAVDEYVSIALLTVLLTPLFVFPAVMLVLGVAAKVDFLLAFVIAAILSIFGIVSVTALFYFYPSMRADGMKRSIDNSLPFASIYLSTLAGTGMPPQAMFKVLSRFPEYGEITKQAQAIVMDTEVVGIDITTSLLKASERTPSPELKDLLNGIRSTITTGGDLKVFLIEKSKGYMSNYRRSIDEYVGQLSIVTEVYITLIIVGSIFLTIMSSIMQMISGGGGSETTALFQVIVVRVVLPLISIGFILYASATAPG